MNDTDTLRAIMDQIVFQLIGQQPNSIQQVVRPNSVMLSLDSRGNIRASAKLSVIKYYPLTYDELETR
jgi:hypothetical protein